MKDHVANSVALIVVCYYLLVIWQKLDSGQSQSSKVSEYPGKTLIDYQNSNKMLIADLFVLFGNKSESFNLVNLIAIMKTRE